MTINAANKEILNSARPGDEILVASQHEYYNGPDYPSKNIYKEVVDIVKDNGKIILLTR